MISNTQQKVDQEKYGERFDKIFAAPPGWYRLEYDPPGTAYEVRTFGGKPYWRPLEQGK